MRNSIFTPFSLSDPYGDFLDEDSQKLLRSIESKKGVDLDAHDFIVIFQTYLPAGTVEELLCYAPLAIRYLQRHFTQNLWMSDGLIDVWESLMFWCYHNKEQLISLNRYKILLKEIHNLMNLLLSVSWSPENGYKEISALCMFLEEALNQPLMKEIYPKAPFSIVESIHQGETWRDKVLDLMLLVRLKDKTVRDLYTLKNVTTKKEELEDYLLENEIELECEWDYFLREVDVACFSLKGA